ncbi:hypothetical protein [Arsenicibacter rosenii]|uniref:Secretion system C-terminal sorting domain-containing protein n=1 Tax=Arsenicibacter rosenii TaxID=1750698 RepID=A0A1S2VG82_9BACT|nr:hypothetical protein [Arsenicibacter rosenii]OIN57767.1 hypothetical protein BLX24_18165 [Arsenicibacter rosenii]
MKLVIFLIVSLLASVFGSLVLAQTPFTVTWGFDGNTGAVSSSPNVQGSGANLTGVNLSGISPYAPGQSGQAGNIQNWSVSTCNYSEFVQITLQPLNGEKMTLTGLSFFFNRSNAGPQEVYVRSGADGFSGDIGAFAVTDSYQQANIGLSYANVAGSISFRIYACKLISQGGTLRLDNIVVSGTVTQTPTPVSLLYFRAQPEQNGVQTEWATIQEDKASHFVVQRSRDGRAYERIHEQPATGGTQIRQQYTFRDKQPLEGTSYYQLLQLDSDGRELAMKPVPVTVKTNRPLAVVAPNPASPTGIGMVLQQAIRPEVSVLTTNGRPVTGQWRQTGMQTGQWIPDQPLSPGLYWLVLIEEGTKQVIAVLVK